MLQTQADRGAGSLTLPDVSYHRLREEGSLGSHQMRPRPASFCLHGLSFPICKPRSLNREAESSVFHTHPLVLPCLKFKSKFSADFDLISSGWPRLLLITLGTPRAKKGPSISPTWGIWLLDGLDCGPSDQHPTCSFLFPYCVFLFRTPPLTLHSPKYQPRESHSVKQIFLVSLSLQSVSCGEAMHLSQKWSILGFDIFTHFSHQESRHHLPSPISSFFFLSCWPTTLILMNYVEHLAFHFIWLF